jgi:hypothetical protein
VKVEIRVEVTHGYRECYGDCSTLYPSPGGWKIVVTSSGSYLECALFVHGKVDGVKRDSRPCIGKETQVF